MANKYLKVAMEAALNSGYFIRRSVGKIGSISYKSRNNIVTDIDKASEAMIIKMIEAKFPKHSFLAEESLVSGRASSYRWVIDPLDGTSNFARSFPFFCVSIALEHEGVIIAGVVYDPMRDELFWASKGAGAYLNKRRICVSKVRNLADGFLATGFSYKKSKRFESLVSFKRFLMRCMAVRRAGSAALDLSYVACGRFDGFWEMDLNPWDSAAGVILVKEAGGRVTKFDGTKYSHYDKVILATNSLIHNQMVKVLMS